jgi:hypothetical protein
MASRNKAVKIPTPSVEELQALFDLGSEPRLVADEFGSPLDIFNLVIMATRILVDTPLADSRSAKDFLAKLAGARVDDDIWDLHEQVAQRTESLYEAAIRNSAEAQRDLHDMAEQVFKDFSPFSAEYTGYVAKNWQ